MDEAARLERLRLHLRVIDDDVARVVVAHSAHIECRRGCADCCHQTFRVSEIEGALLREGLASLDEAPRASIVARALAYRPDQREPCPVLGSDGACSLYAWRPRICRKYGIPLWHPDRPNEVRTCEKNFRGVADIDPDLILDPQAAWARDWIRLREAIGQRHDDVATIAEHLVRMASP